MMAFYMFLLAAAIGNLAVHGLAWLIDSEPNSDLTVRIVGNICLTIIGTLLGIILFICVYGAWMCARYLF